MPLPVVDLGRAFAAISEAWHPHVAADVDEVQVKLARLAGTFEWHHHAEEDELFLVHQGRLRILLRDGQVELGPGQLVVIPKGVEHCPETVTDEVLALLIERRSTVNTGETPSARTVTELPRIQPSSGAQPSLPGQVQQGAWSSPCRMAPLAGALRRCGDLGVYVRVP